MVMIVILLPSLIHRLIWGELDCYFVIVIVIVIILDVRYIKLLLLYSTAHEKVSRNDKCSFLRPESTLLKSDYSHWGSLEMS